MSILHYYVVSLVFFFILSCQSIVIFTSSWSPISCNGYRSSCLKRSSLSLFNYLPFISSSSPWCCYTPTPLFVPYCPHVFLLFFSIYLSTTLFVPFSLYSLLITIFISSTLSLSLVMSLTQTNRTVENIGARRLHTVIERIVEEVSFDAPDKAGETVIITEEYVKQRLGDLLMKGDMKKYIL